ncbi:MAG TPA: hypothetical protein VN222_14930 [Novosphingobium sp.]|nr:hypothetical protein [Novosphingobium sp.]
MPHKPNLSQQFAVTRRGACGLALAGAAGVMAPGVAGASALAGGMALQVLYEAGSANARLWQDEAGRLGLPAHAVAGDPTALWLARLRPFWQARGDFTIGCTSADALFLIEMLGRDAGQRLVLCQAAADAAPTALPHFIARATRQTRRIEAATLPGHGKATPYLWALRRSQGRQA